MNDKKNTNPNPKKPKLKKISGYSAYIYLALAICIVTALTIGIFSISNDYKNTYSIPEISIPNISTPQTSEAPVGGEESGIDNVIVETPQYCMPVENGTIGKAYSGDAAVKSITMQDYRVHSGIDIEAALDSPVRAYAAGTVLDVFEHPMEGMTVVLEHSNGVVTYYKGLAKELPAEIVKGAEVKAGDTIGKIGKTMLTEISENPHLHFEMTVAGDPVDPVPELDGLK